MLQVPNLDAGSGGRAAVLRERRMMETVESVNAGGFSVLSGSG